MHRLPPSLEGVDYLSDDHFFSALALTLFNDSAVDFFITHTLARIAGGHPDFAKDVAKNLGLEIGGAPTREDCKIIVGEYFYDYLKSWGAMQVRKLARRSGNSFTQEDFDRYIDLLAGIAAVNDIAALVKPGVLDNREDFLVTARSNFTVITSWVKSASQHAIGKLASDCDKLLPHNFDDDYMNRLEKISDDRRELARYYQRLINFVNDPAQDDNFWERLKPTVQRIDRLLESAREKRPSWKSSPKFPSLDS